jgi:hypothetical protein
MEYFHKLPLDIKTIIKYYTLHCVHNKHEIKGRMCKMVSFTDCTNTAHSVYFNGSLNRITRTYINNNLYKYNCREYSPIESYQIALEHDDDEDVDSIGDLMLYRD